MENKDQSIGPPAQRAFPRRALVGAAGVLLSANLGGCAAPPRRGPWADARSRSAPPTESKVLLAYFSRAGENYYYGGRTELQVGNTEVLAGMIGERIACDVFRIQPADPYPHDYEETVRRNVQEQRADARPPIANPLPSLAPYHTVLLGSPIWDIRTPMIMSTFAECLSFTGKTIFPFVTYAPRQSSVKGSADTFTGDAWYDVIAGGEEWDRMRVSTVWFAPGARTAWHTHPRGQTLCVTEGQGLAQSRGGTVLEIRPGDVVHTRAGEWHWHGAAPEHSVAHLSMLEVDDTGTSAVWGEHVTDAEYQALDKEESRA